MPAKAWLFASLAVCAALSPAAGEAPQAYTPDQLSKIAGWRGTAPKAADAFTFVVVSDRTGGAVAGKWAAAVSQVNLLQPHFVMSIGDFIEGYIEDADEINAQWDEFDALTRKFEAPFFYCPGNHDASNDAMSKIYNQRYGVDGRSYYSFGYRGCHFVVLDSNVTRQPPSFADEQLVWLKADIAAAKDARYVFVFLHHSPWDIAETYSQMAAVLPKGKTTVFCGHRHALKFRSVEGLPVYVLGPTASGAGGERYEGRFRMFAQVALSRGEPTIALVPLDKLLPADYAALTTSVWQLAATDEHNRAIPAAGGTFNYQQENSLAAPLEASITWQAPGWKLAPETAQFAIEPGATARRAFSLRPLSSDPPRPKLTVTYKFPNPFTGEQVEFVREAALGTYAQLEIARVEKITVDGELGDFADAATLTVDSPNRIQRGLNHWAGPADSSFKLRAATDGVRLCVAVDVMDDQIHNDIRWHRLNDAIEFFWDARPADKRDGRHGPGTGHVVLVVPDKGAEPQVKWFMGGRGAPKDLQAVFKRRGGGFVCELSIGLAELGVQSPPPAGQQFRMEVQLIDRDGAGEDAPRTRMSTSGLGRNIQFTGGYIRCTFK